MPQVQSVLNLVDEFLTDFHQKEAAIQERSYTETLSGPAELEKPSSSDVVTNQRGLGKEQTEEARNGGANTDSVAENKDSDGDSPVDDQGPDTLDTDEKLESRSEVLGTTREQEITQEQKVARATNMGNAILQIAVDSMQKNAKCGTCDEDYKGKCPDCGKMNKKAALALPARTQPQGQVADPFDGLSQEQATFVKVAEATAQAAAEDYFHSFLEGIFKRADDESQVAQANIPTHVLEACGGVSGILDKVAMEYPDAVMPEGADLEEGMDGAGGDGGEGGLPMMPPGGEEGGDIGSLLGGGEELPEEGGELPMEGGEMGGLGEEGGEGGGDIEQLADALDQAGVTPEDLEEAFTQVQALQDAGVEPEELAQALEEISSESGGAMGGMEGGEEEVAPPIDKAASMDKVARQRIDAIKEYLTEGQ